MLTNEMRLESLKGHSQSLLVFPFFFGPRQRSEKKDMRLLTAKVRFFVAEIDLGRGRAGGGGLGGGGEDDLPAAARAGAHRLRREAPVREPPSGFLLSRAAHSLSVWGPWTFRRSTFV